MPSLPQITCDNNSLLLQMFCPVNLSNVLSPWFWRSHLTPSVSLFAHEIFVEETKPQEYVPQDESNACTTKSIDFLGSDMTFERASESVGDRPERQRYSERYISYFFIPMIVAPW
ncbi:hypothetical protein F5B18DRAFT_618001 [Nemania serpens]|nr:hypothetical protein F5B18DRAFT_618001 [Nemania serpens]